MVRVLDQLTHVLKHRLEFRLGRLFRFLGSGFVDLIDPIGLYSSDQAPFATPPFYFNPHVIRQTPRSKHPHRVVARQISSPANHFLALHWHRSAIDPDLGADSMRIRRDPFQSHAHSRRAALVAIKAGRPVEIVHHDVQISIVIQIGQTHALGNSRRIESPLRACIFKTQITQVPECQIFSGQAGKHLPRVELLQGRELLRGFGGFNLAEGVQVHVVTLEAVRHQKVFISIEVNIQENRGP